MAAILAPSPHHPAPPRRPDLRLVPGGRPAAPDHRPAASPYLRRRLVALVGATRLWSGLRAGARTLLAPLAEPAPAGPVAGATTGGEAVVVAPGDTLWSIARRAQPTGDIRPLVDRLAAAHGSTPLVPGERITIPR